jgi:pimeloyl-ACP methyl ester carboxylesterase
VSRQIISPVWYLQALRRWLTGHAPADEPRLIYSDPTVAAVWLPGQTTRLIVVFQSARRRSLKEKRLDFRAMAWDHGRNHVLFVSDRRKSWYSRPGQRERITGLIRQFAARHGVETIWAVGSSMGGYGAILFSNRVPFSQVIAFVPQLLITDAVTSGANWARNRPNITVEVERDLVPILASTSCRVHLVYGDQDADDLIHLNHLRQTLPDSPNVKLVLAPGKDHGIAPWLNAQGQLAQFATALWTGDRQALEECSMKLDTPLDLSLA